MTEQEKNNRDTTFAFYLVACAALLTPLAAALVAGVAGGLLGLPIPRHAEWLVWAVGGLGALAVAWRELSSLAKKWRE